VAEAYGHFHDMSIISCPTGRQLTSQIGLPYSMEWLNQLSFVVSPMRQLSRKVTSNAGILCAKAAVLRDTTKEAFSITDVSSLVTVSLIRVCVCYLRTPFNCQADTSVLYMYDAVRGKQEHWAKYTVLTGANRSTR
jgi:hypothetical protein